MYVTTSQLVNMRLHIPVAVLRVICFAVELYTSITPNRMTKIREYTCARLQDDEAIRNTPTCEVWPFYQISTIS